MGKSILRISKISHRPIDALTTLGVVYLLTVSNSQTANDPNESRTMKNSTQETTSTLGRMTDDEKTALQNAITNKKGEYRKRANKDKGEIAIYPMMYNRIRRIADRYSISVTQNEIEFMIDDCIARYTSAEWDTTNAGKGRDEIIKKHPAVRLYR